MSIIKTITTVGGWTMLHRLTSLVRDALQASFLGASIFSDAFSVSFKLANILRKLFSEGSFNASFLPVFANSLKDHGKSRAEKIASQVMTFLAIALTLFLIASMFGFEKIIQGYAPGLKIGTEKYAHTVNIAMICFPYVVTSFFTALFSGVLNSINKFALPAAIHVLLNIFLICALAMEPLGLIRFEKIAYAMAYATLFGGITQAIILYINVWKSGYVIKFTTSIQNTLPEVKEIFKKMLSGVMGAGVLQINIFIGYMMISYLPTGSTTYVYFSDHLHQVPVGILGAAFSTALLPPLTKAIKEKRIQSVNNQLNFGLLYALLFSLPAAALMGIGSDWLTAATYGSGKFGFEQICNAAPTLAAFCCGLPPYMAMKVVSTTFFANKDTRTPMIASVISIISNLFFCFIFLPTFQHTAIAIATSFSSAVAAIYLICNLSKLNNLKISKKTYLGIVQLLLLTIVSFFALYALYMYDPYWWNNTDLIFGQFGLPGTFHAKKKIILFINGIGISSVCVFIFYGIGKVTGVFKFLQELKKEQIDN